MFNTGAKRLAEALAKNTRLKALFLDCDLCKGIDEPPQQLSKQY